jgi:antirestriction protein ArdC
MSAATVGEDRLAAIHAQLLDQVTALASSQAWRAMLKVAARFHSYSPNNVLLIAAQHPEATRVTGYRAWTHLGRQVRKGERGIAILAPVLHHDKPGDQPTPPTTSPGRPAHAADPPARVAGFRVTHVFDISQTDGPDLPDIRPTVVAGAAPLGLWADLLDQVEAAGYQFGYADLAPANGRTDFTDRTVLIDRTLPGAQKTKTLAHELAHVTLHAPDVRPDGLTRDRAEIEAESVAYVVTAAHGLATEDYTVPYVTGWAGGDATLVAATATRVLTTARSVLRGAPPPAPTVHHPTPVIERHLEPALLPALREPRVPIRTFDR